MKENIVPETLPPHDNSFYQSNLFFTKENNKNVHCYFHASNRGWVFPLNMHSHEFYEINLIVGGQGFHYINNQRLNINVGDVFILPPNCKHGYFEISNLEIFHILINDDFISFYKKHFKSMNGFDSLFNIEPNLRSQTINNAFLHLTKEQFNEILKDIENLLQYSENNVYHYNIQSAMTFQMICKFCNFHQQSITKTQNSQAKNSYVPLIIFSIEFMKKNLSQKLTNDSIAKELSISTTSFKRHFKEIVKMPPMEYLTKLRIKQSKKLLRNTTDSLINIALECGFFDTAHFFRQFKKFENISPSEYRRNQTK